MKENGKTLDSGKSGIQKVMGIKDYFGDSLGQFAMNAMTTLVGQLTYFYTDKIGLAAGAVATIFLICKVIDAFTDLLMGGIIANTKPGKERYRPWIIKAGIPAGITLALVFMVPKGIGVWQLVYVFITNLLLTAVFFTAFLIPYSSLMVVRTDSQEERGMMGTWRGAAGYLSGMVVAIGVIPITNALGGTQSAWVKFGVVLGLFSILAFLITYVASRETVAGPEVKETEKEEKILFTDTILKLFHNKYWVMMLGVSFLSSILYGVIGSSGVYYCKWIYGNDNLMGLLGAIGMIPTFLGFAAMNLLLKKFGVVKTMKISFFLGMVANTMRLFRPEHFWYNVFFESITTFATIPMMCLLSVMSAMAIDYNEFQYGTKMIAQSNSISSFGAKIGSGIGASVIGWLLLAADYDASLSAAPIKTKMAIYGFSIVIPLVLFLLMYLLIWKFDLEKRLPEMRKQREEGNAVGSYECRIGE